MAKKKTRSGKWVKDPVDGILRKLEKEVKTLENQCSECGAIQGHFPRCSKRRA